MIFPKRKKAIIGLDIGSHSIKIAQITEIAGSRFLEKAGLKLIDPEMIVDGTIMDAGGISEAIRELLQEEEITTQDVTLSVSGHSVIVKKILLPFMSEDELEETIKWEAEQYIPFDINDVNIDYAIMNTTVDDSGGEQMSILLVAVKKEKLNEYTSVVMDCGLNPVIVDVDVFALENMYCNNYDISDNEIAAIINIGASVMNISILREGNFAFTRDISIGGLHYTEEIQKELGLNYEEAEAAKCNPQQAPGDTAETVKNIISNLNMEVVSEIIRSFDFFKTSSTEDQVSQIYLSGGGSKIIGLVPFLEEKLEIEVMKINPFAKITPVEGFNNPDRLKDYPEFLGVCVGLALRRLGDR